jgi:metallo-beta-lactamase family protein
MTLSFHGAARCVTGSKHLIKLKNGQQVLLDCGLFQGMGKDTDIMNRDFGFEPSEVTAMVLSHAHMDHSGLIPKLCKEGFTGKIYCTPATKQLTNVLLQDSAEIQEEDVRFTNKRKAAQGLPYLKPLYTVEDARACISQLAPVEYGSWFNVLENVQCMFTDAGHIIGSEVVNLKIVEDGKTTAITFSGDVGRYRDIILRSPEVFPQADVIIMESTYGDSLHTANFTTPDLLLEWIEKTCIQKKGNLIMPAFSVGRTQELLYAFNQLELENRLPALDYFVDSPLSMQATTIIKSFPKYFNQTIQKILETDNDPFAFKGLKFISTVEQSKQLNYKREPFVVISASGMAEAGRVKHHISNNIESDRNTILLTGYCEPNSLGGRLMAGQKEISIFGVRHQVHAEIGAIRSMSAHGDYEDLSQWLSCQDPRKVRKLFIVHGDYEVQQVFKQRLLKKNFFDVEIPAMHSEFGIGN